MLLPMRRIASGKRSAHELARKPRGEGHQARFCSILMWLRFSELCCHFPTFPSGLASSPHQSLRSGAARWDAWAFSVHCNQSVPVSLS